MKNYNNETEGQLDFYNKFLKRIDKLLTLDEILSDNNDGVLNGNLIEFKLNINDLNSVLFQSIKYLSAMRVKGKSIPANIVLISLNNDKTYIYNSEDYLQDIEKTYVGAASKNNTGFVANTIPQQLDFSIMDEAEELIKILKSKKYTKINIDENCIIGWAIRYYTEQPNAKKSDFIGDEGQIKVVGEIRRPTIFKDFINSYEKSSNIRFKYLMDKLNDDLSKKDLGAFYTPEQYVKLSTELVREAIKRVPQGNDYIILDRCAGTGNLEQFLTDEELSHCVVSTYEYYEYKVLMELYGDKVRHVIPPYEDNETYNNGTVLGADALSKEYIENKTIQNYINNPNCTIIMLENPPYAENNGNTRGKNKKGVWKNNFATIEMKKEITNNKLITGTATNDLANIFIWSAFKYYLRQDTDSYILFSPIKYWKAQHIINKDFLNGFAFNRRFFHTNTEACISCILWSNKDSKIIEFDLQAFNIIESKLVDEGNIKIKKVYNSFSKMFSDKLNSNLKGIACELNGTESFNVEKIVINPIYDDVMIAYLVANQFGFDNARLNAGLVRCARYDGHGSYMTIFDFLYKLPLFAATKYTDNINNWKIMSQLMKSSDKKDNYLQDCKSGIIQDWLLKVLLWSSLTNQSHMRSFHGSDGRYYRNELSLDTVNGETLATKYLSKLVLNKSESILIKQWENILDLAKQTKLYNPKYTYGIFQIEEELDTFKEAIDSKNKKHKIYDYPDLHGQLNTIKSLLKDYYINELTANLFKYELLK